jgi:superfamily II DNA or RNA helicase
MNIKDIIKKYKKYEIKPKKETIDDFCNPSSFKLQQQQSFLADFFPSKDSLPGMLVYHQIGAGKTCAAISVAEQMKKTHDIIVVVPAALIGNFMDELRSQCADEEYITKKERADLVELQPGDKAYKEIIKKTEARIKKYYSVYSYHKFIDLIQNNKIKLKKTLLIVDEVQNMVSLSGTFYKELKKTIDKSTDETKILLLSATPMFDRPGEIGLTLNLLKPKKVFPIGTEFNQMFLKSNYKMKNINKFTQMCQGLISYYRGAPPYTYPEQIFKVVKCNMTNFQYKSYLTTLSTTDFVKGSFKNVDILDLSPSFFLGSRMVSNVAFPNKSIGDLGFSSFKDDYLQLQNVGEYSIKFLKIFKKMKKSTGPIFFYSNFKDYGGIRSFITFIEYHGYANYKVHGQGTLRYAVWTGDEPLHMKEEIKKVFNMKENKDGSLIRLIIGSPSVKEGVSFKRVRQVHILEPYWNMSRILQIIGRAIRFCSHKDLTKPNRNVEVYLYLSTYYGEETIDQHIWKIAQEKSKLIEFFETALKESAVDCNLFYNRNVYNTDEYKLKCKL